MKRFFLFLALCMTTLLCVAQPPHNGRGGQHFHDNGRPSRHHHEQMECATKEQMMQVMKVLQKESFDEDRTEIAKLCVIVGYFCTRDLAMMAETFGFDNNRLDFLRFAYPYCTDPQNYFMLRDCFTFKSNFDELMDYIRPATYRR